MDDKFECFVRYLNDLNAKRPGVLIGDAACGYWEAIASVTRAANVANFAVTGVALDNDNGYASR